MAAAKPFRDRKQAVCPRGSRKLIPAVILVMFAVTAFFVAVGPSLDFSYPIHVDEWTQLAYAEALVEHGSVPHVEPLYGLDSVSFRPELGFRVALAELRLVTGMEWEDMFPVLPGALFVVFAITMLYLGRCLGASLLVGVLALGTPTTIRFLGPAFVVPVALALTFLAALPLVLLEPSLRQGWSMVILAAVILFATLFVHPPTAIMAAVLVVGIAGYRAIWCQGVRKGPMWGCVALGLLGPAVWFGALSGSLRLELLAEAARSAEAGQGLVTDFAYYAGFVRLVLLTIGIFAIIFWKMRGKPQLPYVVVLAAYVALVAFIGLHGAGILPAANFYDRSWLYLDVMISVVAGLGLAVFAERLFQWRYPIRHALSGARVALPVLLACLIVANAVYVKVQETPYRLASEASIQDFRWIEEHLTQTPGLTLLDPLVAVIYPSITGRPVYASAAEPKPSSEERVQRARELLGTALPDVEALNQENIGIVYRPGWQISDGMDEVHPGIFVVAGR